MCFGEVLERTVR